MEKQGQQVVPRFLEGDWISVAVEEKCNSQWVIVKRFAGREKSLWRFQSDGYLMIFVGQRCGVHAVHYFNNQDNSLKFVGFSVGSDGGYGSEVVDNYRVEIISPQEIILYDLKDVVEEPDDYRQRIIMKRDVSTACSQ